MPYAKDHTQRKRAEIVEKSRILFNRYGVEGVSIDAIMAEVGLTRGGFYKYFENKEALFAEAVSQFLYGQGARNREAAGVYCAMPGPATIVAMIDGYLASEHLDNLDGQCPMIAMPSDIARAGEEVKQSYQELLCAMAGLFEHNLSGKEHAREKALSLCALCVGGMVLARTLPDEKLAKEVREAARATALAQVEEH